MSAEEIENSLRELKNWKVDGVNLKKRFGFGNFAEALDFVNKVGAVAEERDHHPDIYFGWGLRRIFNYDARCRRFDS